MTSEEIANEPGSAGVAEPNRLMATPSGRTRWWTASRASGCARALPVVAAALKVSSVLASAGSAAVQFDAVLSAASSSGASRTGAGAGSGCAVPMVVSKETVTPTPHTLKLAEPCTCQPFGPVSVTAMVAASNCWPLAEMATEPPTSTTNWNGLNWNSASKYRSPCTVMPNGPWACRSIRAPNCAVLEVSAR